MIITNVLNVLMDVQTVKTKTNVLLVLEKTEKMTLLVLVKTNTIMLMDKMTVKDAKVLVKTVLVKTNVPVVCQVIYS